MALKPCRECGTEVSEDAKVCPHCGVQWPANALQLLAGNLGGLGCLLTLLVTVPILLIVMFVGFC
jgi:hypothetical protein